MPFLFAEEKLSNLYYSLPLVFIEFLWELYFITRLKIYFIILEQMQADLRSDKQIFLWFEQVSKSRQSIN